MAAKSLRARQAALLLHALPPEMRRKAIARLDATESAKLEPLLVELAELGIPEGIGRKLESLARESARKANDVAPSALDAADRLSAMEVLRRVEVCTSATLAQLLQAQDWTWKAELMDRLTEARRAEVLACMRGSASTLAPAALRVLCERLQLEPDMPPRASRNQPPLLIDTMREQRRSPLRVRIRTSIRRALAWMR